MCGIAGIYTKTPRQELLATEFLLKNMISTLKHRGPDDLGIFLCPLGGLAHKRLSIIDLATGHQPMIYEKNNRQVAITYNGELYNMKELKNHLLSKGYSFSTSSDTEVILFCYIEYGPDFVTKLNGIFSFAIIDETNHSLLLYRDHAGIKPLFYSILNNGTVIFASELKAILAHPLVKPQIDCQGLNEIFSIGPAKTPGCGVFKNVKEVLPGTYLTFTPTQTKSQTYWQLTSRPHTDCYEHTLEKTRYLVTDAIEKQMISDVPICTFLSGGVDSSIVSAICANKLKEQGEQLTTFSFDFESSERYFVANAFQPSRDRPYVDCMVNAINSKHYYLECNNQNQIDLLFDSVKAHDLPCMADIDSSMMYFCSIVKDYNKVVLTGECADELFGGYPWFHKKEFFEQDSFPWTPNLEPRKEFLHSDFLSFLHMDDYVKTAYHHSLKELTPLSNDTKEEKRRREISYLNQRWFMQTLLDRTDRTSMYCGLEARVPFADIRIMDYLFNVPWEMKARDGTVKHLLRNACKGIVPDEILFRKKSPYPKTYDPGYENALKKLLLERMTDTKSPLHYFLDAKKLEVLLKNTSDYGKPWYGQLMAGPQMIAYLLQIDFWINHYQIELLL